MDAPHEGGLLEDLTHAEELLHCGMWDSAKAAAARVLQQHSCTPHEVTRALYVILQADFHQNRLTPLEQVAIQHHRKVRDLPVSAVLLWGVIAVELKQLPLARQLLSSYVAANKGSECVLSHEDAMALSRLYAVRVLTEACGDAKGARAWLQQGGAALTHEQQQMLLAEVDETEECALSATAAAMKAAPPTAAQQRAAGGAAAAGFMDSKWCTMLGDPFEEAWEEGLAASGGGTQTAAAAGRQHGQPGAASGGGVGSSVDGKGGGGWVTASSTWVQGKAASWWNSPVVQETLERLHMEELTPLQLAGGTAVAAVVAYALWRERRAIKQAATNAAVGMTAGVAQTVQMALGFAPNPMQAAPSGHYQR